MQVTWFLICVEVNFFLNWNDDPLGGNSSFMSKVNSDHLSLRTDESLIADTIAFYSLLHLWILSKYWESTFDKGRACVLYYINLLDIVGQHYQMMKNYTFLMMMIESTFVYCRKSRVGGTENHANQKNDD